MPYRVSVTRASPAMPVDSLAEVTWATDCAARGDKPLLSARIVGSPANLVRATRIFSTAPRQSPRCVCRNKRMVGYQGESSRCSIHRQSAGVGNINQTRFPIAPARCATAVSTDKIKSNWAIAAACNRGTQQPRAPVFDLSSRTQFADLSRGVAFL